jgi:hypothetical protein
MIIVSKRALYSLCGGLFLIIAGCAMQPEQAEVAIPFDPASKGPPSHHINTAASSARIYVYSGGMMSNLGHNHIVLARDIQGELWLQAAPQNSAFHLKLPVASFIVDPPDLRIRAGADFSSQPTAKDIEGTRHNMLGEKVLNAAQYPFIEIWSERIRGSGEKLTADVVVAARGQLKRISIPVLIVATQNGPTTHGKFSLKQSDIGITPFSIMMGAIAVRDELKIEYSLSTNIN